MTRDAELAAQVDRLERIARELAGDGLTAEALRELADEAVMTADRISGLLPAALDPEREADG